MCNDTLQPEAEPGHDANVIPLNQFIEDFGDGLLEAVSRQNPPVYKAPNPKRAQIMNALKRVPFDAQQEVVQATLALLQNQGERAAIINGEMGCGKTIMAIACAAVLHAEGCKRALCLSPPHLVYKWRREILDTIPNAKVWILNGPDTLTKLLALRQLVREGREETVPEFFILGRVRMRLGYHWRPAFAVRRRYRREQVLQRDPSMGTVVKTETFAACPSCGEIVFQEDDEGRPVPIPADDFPTTKRLACQYCDAPLWTLMHRKAPGDHKEIVKRALVQLPTIGPKTADKLLSVFGADALASMLGDNLHQFVNLMDDDGEFVFSDRQATRMERALGRLELAFGQGSYQPSEFIKRVRREVA